MTTTPTKRSRGRPKLSPEEKAKRAEEVRLRKNARDREKRRIAREAKIKSEGIDVDQEYLDRLAKQKEKNEANPNVGQNGGARPGAGRPIGSKNIYSYDSVKKLEAMGFDPLEKLTELYNEIQDTLSETDEETGKTIVKKGSMAHATLLGHLKSISDTLAKYSYRAVPERKEVDFGDKTPTIINLTGGAKKTKKEDKA